MNTYWSQYVQKTEELYSSRGLKFHRGNIDKWIDIMQLHDGMKILEVGCAGGLLCHRLKERLTTAEITGIDFDTGHIDYAKKKSIELNLQCDFVAGDATQLPFEDNTFDVCFSHTVMNFCEPSRFVSEQHRVLKPGGRMIIMDVYGRGVKPEEWIPADAVDLYLTLTHNENIKKHCNKRSALVCVIYSFLTTVTLPSGGCCSFIHSHRNSRVSFT